MVKYLLGVATNKGWNVLTYKVIASQPWEEPRHTRVPYEYKNIDLARKQARKLINEGKFSNILIYKNTNTDYTYMGHICFESITSYAPLRHKWEFKWHSNDGKIRTVNKNGSLAKM